MTVPEYIIRSAIKDMNANLEEALNDTTTQPHLLLLHHSFGYDLVDCRLYEAVELCSPPTS